MAFSYFIIFLEIAITFFAVNDSKTAYKGKGVVKIKVECYSGYRSEETPRRFWIQSKKVEIAEVIDRWISPDHRNFRVKGDDDCIYVIRLDPIDWGWELTSFKTSETNIM